MWDSRRPPGQRVISVHLDPEISESTTGASTDTSATPTQSASIDVGQGLEEEVRREKGGRMYKVVMREYIATGHDGYDVFKGNKYLIESEGGQMMSTIVRKYLLGESTLVLFLTHDRVVERVISYRVTVCEPNGTPGQRKYSHSCFHASRHRDDRPT